MAREGRQVGRQASITVYRLAFTYGALSGRWGGERKMEITMRYPLLHCVVCQSVCLS